MTYIDYHVHTKYSPDSNADIDQYILKAKDLGLEYILFTDHMDFDSVDPSFNNINYDDYFSHMKDLEEKYGLPIKLGVEIGYDKDNKKEIEEFLSKYNFHFIIASIHSVNGLHFYNGDLFHGKSKEEAYLQYFQALLEMVENFSNYHVLGHFDFIVRYGPYMDKSYDYNDFKEIIDRILMEVIRNEKGIEVNTSGLRQGQGRTFPKDEVLVRYKELGGKIISLGSDAHFIDDYQAHFYQVDKRLNEIGFKVINNDKYFK